MAFWTLVIIIAFYIIWINTGEILQLNGQLLALMGISAVTGLGANIIDNNDRANEEVTRGQDKDKTKGFFNDILSDRSGINIHRFQNILFTIAIASYFLYQVWFTCKVPKLDTNLILIMGISSGAYLTLKQGENKNDNKTKSSNNPTNTPPNTPTPPPANKPNEK